MRRLWSTVSLLVLTVLFAACANKPKVVIYSSAEEYRNDHFRKRLQEEFPQYDIIIEYLTTGTHAAKLKAEGTKTECDISFDLEYGYFQSLEDVFADLSRYDSSMYLEDLLPSSKYFPTYRNSGAIIINRIRLKSGTSSTDLLRRLAPPRV